MNASRLLLVSLLVTGCAFTLTPATHALAPVEPPRDPRLDTENTLSSDDVTAGLPLLPLTAWRAQKKAAPAVPANRHSYGVGVGIRFRGGDSAFTLNGNYQYWVNDPIRVGVIGDWAFSPIDTFLVAPALWWHPNDRLTLLGAPGLEFESGEGSAAALRVGATYRLMLEKTAIRPFGYYDFVDDRQDAFMFGVSIGI